MRTRMLGGVGAGDQVTRLCVSIFKTIEILSELWNRLFAGFGTADPKILSDDTSCSYFEIVLLDCGA